MRSLFVLAVLAACGSPQSDPAQPSNRGGAPVAVANPLGDLEVESYVPGGMIQVTRDPDGAIRVLAPAHGHVYLDGRLVGVVPVVVPAPPPGRHHLKIEVAGY